MIWEREREEEKIRWLVKQTNNHSKNTYFYYFCTTLLLVVLVLSYFLCLQLMKIEAAGKNESNGSEHIWEWHLVHVHAEYLLFQPHIYIHTSIHMHAHNQCLPQFLLVYRCYFLINFTCALNNLLCLAYPLKPSQLGRWFCDALANVVPVSINVESMHTVSRRTCG